VAKYSNEHICMCVCVSVCLSVSISPEPHVLSLSNFCACDLSPWLGSPPLCYGRQRQGKAIVFYRCSFICFYFVSIDETPAMGSQPNLASSSEVVLIYKCPPKILRLLPPNLGCKTSNFW